MRGRIGEVEAELDFEGKASGLGLWKVKDGKVEDGSITYCGYFFSGKADFLGKFLSYGAFNFFPTHSHNYQLLQAYTSAKV